MKSLLASKTFWIAVVQAAVSVAVVVLTELDMVGYIGVMKSVVDIFIRTLTTDPVRV